MTVPAVRVVTTTGAEGELEPSVVDDFRKDLRGELLEPRDPGYDEARTIWNAMIDRRPALIARCAGVADVVRCVEFAGARNVLVAVRGGGHNVAGNAMCDGGLVIDLSPMKGLRVDPAGRTARAQGGARWRELDHETQAFGLATPGGFVSTTGIAGLTLGGGIAWLMGSHGLACDNLLSADVVTADGGLLTASVAENEDLFWGLRGGGGNFGVVTSLEYRLHPVGPIVLAGTVIHPAERAKELHAFFRELMQTAPDELVAFAALLFLPDRTPVAAIAACYNGPVQEGERALRSLKRFGPPLADQIEPMPYVKVQQLFDESFAAGRRSYWKSGFLRELSDDAIETMTEHGKNAPSPLSTSFVEGFTGAVRRVGREDTAFAHRDSDYNFTIISIWTDPAEDEPQVRWVREYWEAMQGYLAGGVYVNYLGQTAEEGEERVQAAYGPEKYRRLAALKRKYDPSNLFRLNQNIRPGG